MRIWGVELEMLVDSCKGKDKDDLVARLATDLLEARMLLTRSNLTTSLEGLSERKRLNLISKEIFEYFEEG
ncbi:MAG: hypothetical protein GY769_08045 [bacterium]|nr:hypothetical protein [bacterium]